MKDILLSAYECDPDRGSEFGRSWSWAINYIDHGYHVWCLTSERGKASIEDKLRKQPIPRLHFIFIPVPSWIEKKYQKTQSTLWVYVHYWFWLSGALTRAKALSQEVVFDWVHHVSWGSIQQGTALWRLNLPLVFGPVGGGQFPPPFLEKYFLEGWNIEKKRKWVSDILLKLNPNTKKALQKAKLVLVVNEDTKRIAEQFNARKIQYCIDTGLESAQITNGHSKNDGFVNELRVLWVGRLLYRKGLPLVLEALSKVSEKVPFKLTIIGDGPVGKELPQLLKIYKLEKKVEWRGQLPYSEVQKAYMTHDVFMFCSLRESLGLQYFEAMAHGLPIITLDMHGAKNAIPDEVGIKVPLTNVELILQDLAKAVEEMYFKPEQRIEMGKKGIAYLKEIILQDKIELVERYLR